MISEMKRINAARPHKNARKAKSHFQFLYKAYNPFEGFDGHFHYRASFNNPYQRKSRAEMRRTNFDKEIEFKQQYTKLRVS